MRSYDQFCPVAKGLDLIGDRWTLLIVRELLIRGAARYTDLRAGLPGIATNLLADRLRNLQESGIVARAEAPPPVATALFSLTERGRQLQPVLTAIGRWGQPLLWESADDSFQGHWLALPLRLELRDRFPDRPPVTLEVHTGRESLVVEARAGAVTAREGTVDSPEGVLSGPPLPVVALLLGGRPLDELRGAGLDYAGDPAILDRIRPGREAAVAEH